MVVKRFPEFTKLSLAHRGLVDSYMVREKIPHGDFNFSSLWCNYKSGHIALSSLFGNLVVLCTESVHKEYSFLGHAKVNETLDAIFLDEVADIMLLTWASIKEIDTSKYGVVLDRDNSDYVFDLRKLALCEGNEYEAIRHKSNRFKKMEGNSRLSRLQPCRKTEHLIHNLYDRLIDASVDKVRKEILLGERHKVVRLLGLGGVANLQIIGLFIENTLIGFVVNEIVSRNFAIGHFMRADSEVSSDAYSFIFRQLAVDLVNNGVYFINAQQDLGLPGLREKKLELRPTFFNHKYTVFRK